MKGINEGFILPLIKANDVYMILCVNDLYSYFLLVFWWMMLLNIIFSYFTGGSTEGEKCTSEQFQCGEKSSKNPNGGKCIPKRWQCDYHRDCENGEDEIDCRKLKSFSRSIFDNTYDINQIYICGKKLIFVNITVWTISYGIRKLMISCTWNESSV